MYVFLLLCIQQKISINDFPHLFLSLFYCYLYLSYFGQISQLSQGGGNTSAFLGLMQTKGNTVGDGETSDWQSMGTTIFTSMMLLLAYKVLYESRSIINGHWPAITCSKDSEGYLSRLPYTWYGVLIGSFLFYAVFLYTYTVSRCNSMYFLSF